MEDKGISDAANLNVVNDKCIFCKIAAGQDEATNILYEVITYAF